MEKKFSIRRAFLIFAMPVLIIAMLFLTDPDADVATTKLYLLHVASMLIAVTLAHWVMKAIFHYPEANRQRMMQRVKEEGCVASAVTLCAQAGVFIALLFIFASVARAQDVRTYIPAKCAENMKIL